MMDFTLTMMGFMLKNDEIFPGDYATESGCTRNFEAWREKEQVEASLVAEKGTLKDEDFSLEK